MLVSIVIPTYNRAHLVGQAIKSVLDQTYADFEIIVVDDGSTDETRTVVDQFKNQKISYIYQPNSGLPSIARNTGLKAAKGDLIGFLDSDDLWMPEKLATQIKCFETKSEVLAISTNLAALDTKQKPLLKLSQDKVLTFKELCRSNPIANSSVLMRRCVLDYIGFLNEDKKLCAVEDYEYWLRILKFRDSSFLVMYDCLIEYRVHSQNISTVAFSNMFEYEKFEQILGKYSVFNKEIPCILAKKKSSALRKTYGRFSQKRLTFLFAKLKDAKLKRSQILSLFLKI